MDGVRQAVRLVSPRRLLDVGCGCGGLAAHLSGRYIGVDMDLGVLSGVTGGGDVLIVCADALALPFRSSSVDLVVASGLLHHVPSLDLAVTSFRRVLEHGGVLLVRDGTALADDTAREMNQELVEGGHQPEPRAGIEVPTLVELLHRSRFAVQTVANAGTMTFATPPFTQKTYQADAFLLTARAI